MIAASLSVAAGFGKIKSDLIKSGMPGLRQGTETSWDRSQLVNSRAGDGNPDRHGLIGAVSAGQDALLL
jgi:hypothetical protein